MVKEPTESEVDSYTANVRAPAVWCSAMDAPHSVAPEYASGDVYSNTVPNVQAEFPLSFSESFVNVGHVASPSVGAAQSRSIDTVINNSMQWRDRILVQWCKERTVCATALLTRLECHT